MFPSQFVGRLYASSVFLLNDDKYDESIDHFVTTITNNKMVISSHLVKKDSVTASTVKYDCEVDG